MAQAKGIVECFNWYPGIEGKQVKKSLDPTIWKKLFSHISPEILAADSRPFAQTQFFTRVVEAYGAALGGLTGAIVVISTISTTIDVATFAGARLLDTAIGILASLVILAIWQPKSAFESVTEAATRAGSDALRLAADFLDDSMQGQGVSQILLVNLLLTTTVEIPLPM